MNRTPDSGGVGDRPHGVGVASNAIGRVLTAYDGCAVDCRRTAVYTGWAKKKLRQIFLATTLVNMDRF